MTHADVEQWQMDWAFQTIDGWLDKARHVTAMHMGHPTSLHVVRGDAWPVEWSTEDRLAVAWILEDWDQFADMGCHTDQQAWGRLCYAMGWTDEGAENMRPIMEELRNEV